MNRLIYFTIVFLAAVLTGCSKTDYLLYNDIARVQLTDTATLNSTFVYKAGNILRDTVYIQVNTIGQMADHDRPVKLVQVNEPNELHPAVPGLHYVAMDDPSLKELMVIKANTVTTMVPVVLLRDASLKNSSYRLRLELAANDQFGLGEVQKRTRAIRFSDMLERFFSWRLDGTAAPAYNSFGKYSTRKHQFMIETLGLQIDETWYQSIVAAGAVTHYANFMKDALKTFNADPAHIADGTAPLRESNAVGSPTVTFP